ncbi:hypothetical protein Pmar_PMAR009577 [Perkinsus marinus ATCC 50983]|uniref:Peptidase S26 domain-containing protein n=1 Tax=Perkinsus marinus (strain ATCC 50983 / TXsc) TaxID=423536 RepID=C5KEK4_PERM5|nr:hypothetical protein Pmar_PMAR009577 [Perkinsus marinus ATCC 50983]EER17142.1 hypothetical protein Pmar_PMAR009577 [Perkinsus marinus ATCC 50983]|eukprot:XP_002785346.1 hypothetical protein Pmar_PMAR009577 [Perkinsus marinus ATCC 50983]
MAAMVATTTSGGFREALLYGWKWIQFAGLLHCTQEYVFDFSTTQGGSMEPSIRSQGCVLFYDKVSPRVNGYNKGDVVIATAPHGGHQICKRIAGVPANSRSSLLVVPVKEKTTSTRLGRLGEVCDMTTRATPGRGIEQLPYFLSFEIIAFIPMALGFSLALVLLTRYLMARTDPYSPFFLGSAMCMAFPVILSAWRNTARSSNSNQVLSFLLALTITPIASFNTSRLFGVDTPRSNIPLSSFQQALLVDLGLQDYLPILRGITYMLLYIGLLLAVYTIVEPSIRSTDILNAWIRGGQTAHIREAACNSVCREVPSEDTLDSIRGGAVAMTRDWILRYFGLLSPMVIPLLFAPSTSPLSVAQHSAIPTLPDFITWGIAISIIDITTYGTLRGMVQYWLLNGDQETSPDRLERDTRYMRTMYTAFECAIVPRLITIFMDIDLMLRMIPTILGIRLVDDSIVDLSSILPIIPSRTDINYSQ